MCSSSTLHETTWIVCVNIQQAYQPSKSPALNQRHCHGYVSDENALLAGNSTGGWTSNIHLWQSADWRVGSWVPGRSCPKQRSEHFPGSEGALSNAEGKFLWHFMRSCFTAIQIFHCSACLTFTDEPTDFVASSATSTSFIRVRFLGTKLWFGRTLMFLLYLFLGRVYRSQEWAYVSRAVTPLTRHILWSV